MNAILRNTSTPTRNSDSPHRLVRPSREVRRLLGDSPVLLLDDDADRVRSWLGRNVIPPTVRLEAGHETETLTSSLIPRLARMGIPLIFEFLGGWQAVTQFANTALEVE